LIILAFVSALWFHDNAEFVALANREPCHWENEGWHEVDGNPKHHLLINETHAIWTQRCK